jgi:hypothetical protein
MPTVPLPTFDKSKPIHRLVVANLAAHVGLLSVIFKGMELLLEKIEQEMTGYEPVTWPSRLEQLRDEIESRTSDPGAPPEHVAHGQQQLATLDGMAEGFKKLTGPLQLGSTAFPNAAIEVAPDDVAREFLALYQRQPDVLNVPLRAAYSILIESKDALEAYRNQTPIWEFLRHCRNAAAHNGGCFNFINNEPRRPAEWRGIVITQALQGSPLFKRPPNGDGLIGPGDVIYLLHDIEQLIP